MEQQTHSTKLYTKPAAPDPADEAAERLRAVVEAQSTSRSSFAAMPRNPCPTDPATISLAASTSPQWTPGRSVNLEPAHNPGILPLLNN